MVVAAGIDSLWTWVVVQRALDESPADAVPGTVVVVVGPVAMKGAR
jgi:hypothetical protein